MFAKDQFRESFFLKSNLPDYSASRKTNRNKLFGNICYKQKRKKAATHVLFLKKAYCFLFVYHEQCEYFDQTKWLFMPVRYCMVFNR